MDRFYIAGIPLNGSQVSLSDNKLIHQLKDVLRLKPKSVLAVFNGEVEREAEVVSMERNELVLKLGRAIDRQSESTTKLTMYAALIKGERFEWALQKMTELGVAKIVPMITERTIVRDLSSAKRERYEAIIKEAVEQSGRMQLPELADVMNFEKVVQTVDSKNSFVLHTKGEQELSDFSLSEINLLIGPEGGFSGQEIELAEKQGIKVARFGARILRAETACVATATKILYS